MRNLITPDDVISALQNGEIGLFPCDTIWGLVGLPSTAKRLHIAKNRPAEQAFLFLMSSLEMAQAHTQPWTPTQSAWLHQFWPGPITAILHKAPFPAHQAMRSTGADVEFLGRRGLVLPNEEPQNLADAPVGSIALRVPRATWLTDVLKSLNSPLLSTSANLSGHSFATTPEHCSAELLAHLDFCYTPPEWTPQNLTGSPSPIIDLTLTPPRILRSGRFA